MQRSCTPLPQMTGDSGPTGGSRPRAFIPLPYLEKIMMKDEVDAIIASLPCDPIYVKTPKLLGHLTGKEWSPTIISHDLFRIWVSTVFYMCSNCGYTDKTHPLWGTVIQDLRNEQQEVYEASDTAGFTLPYLNAYERAIVKYIQLLKEPATAGSPISPITVFIMEMQTAKLKELGILELFTSALPVESLDTEMKETLTTRCAWWRSYSENLLTESA